MWADRSIAHQDLRLSNPQIANSDMREQPTANAVEEVEVHNEPIMEVGKRDKGDYIGSHGGTRSCTPCD